MDYPSVSGLSAQQDGPVLTLTLDRPDRRNAVNDEMLDAMIGHFAAAGIDESVRVIRINATGPDFCAGSDLVANNTHSERKPRVGRQTETEAGERIGRSCHLPFPDFLARFSLQTSDHLLKRHQSPPIDDSACPRFQAVHFLGWEGIPQFRRQQCMSFNASAAIRVSAQEATELVEVGHHLVSQLLGNLNRLCGWFFESTSDGNRSRQT